MLRLLSVSMLLALAARAADGEPIPLEEPPILLLASERLPADELVGERFRVLEPVENDGFLNTWALETDWGHFEADGDHMLAVRRREVAALAELEQVTRKQAFLDAMEAAFTGPWRAARHVLENPVETVKKLPSGVARTFRRYKRRATDLAAEARQEYREVREDVDDWRARRAADEATEAEADGGEAPLTPEEAAEAEAEREAARGSQLDEAVEVARDVGEEASRFIQRKSGYRKARRAWAKALGVDPYGDNAVLNRELFRVAVASAAGGFSLRLAGLPSVPGLSELGDINDVVYDLDPLDLRLRNERVFAGLGFDRSFTDPLYDSKAWNARLITDLADAIEALAGVRNLHALMAWAAAAETRDGARFQAAVARYYAELHRREPLAFLHEGDDLVAAVRDGGPAILGAAFDHLAWTEQWAEVFTAAVAQIGAEVEQPLELHLDGDSTDRLRRETSEAGVRLVENAF